MDEFPLCAHMVSDEYEQLSSEGKNVLVVSPDEVFKKKNDSIGTKYKYNSTVYHLSLFCSVQSRVVSLACSRPQRSPSCLVPAEPEKTSSWDVIKCVND